MVNPVLPQVLAVLRDHPDGISEYSLMKALDRQRLFEDQNGAGPGLLPLYRKHFLIMNALYDLQDILWQEENRVLEISPLHIELHERQRAESPEQEPEWYPQLAEYYLDWNEYSETTAEDIDRMMAALNDKPSLPH
ncbi:DNA-J related domain-containing protein [Marinobacterium mangrovicola]|uniref:DnaJ-like protein n=1 Tax=Marinobacterium mangrovicola TaxID=1476959 RepID=A0A4R1GBU9_9GAMM|nr:DNA-J related domain-containing protein [Marinobacterium mangrovicola]TCK05697.1 DnaJ-like protein [Marinobacterium mangrovicola]